MNYNQKITLLVELIVNLAWLDSQAQDLEIAARYSSNPESRARFCATAATDESDRIDAILAATPGLLNEAIAWHTDRMGRVEAQYDLELGQHIAALDAHHPASGFACRENARWQGRNEEFELLHNKLAATRATLEAYAATIVK